MYVLPVYRQKVVTCRVCSIELSGSTDGYNQVGLNCDFI